MEADRTIQRIREQLLGRYFSTKHDLRHIAEGAGFDFVPVEVLTSGDTEALMALRPEGVGEVRVHAVRPVAWQQFYIVDVKAA